MNANDMRPIHITGAAILLVHIALIILWLCL